MYESASNVWISLDLSFFQHGCLSRWFWRWWRFSILLRMYLNVSLEIRKVFLNLSLEYVCKTFERRHVRWWNVVVFFRENRRRPSKRQAESKYAVFFSKTVNFSIKDRLLREFWIILRRSCFRKFWSKGAILTLPWKTTDQQDRFCYLFGVAVRFDWIKFDVWLKQAFLIIWVDPNCRYRVRLMWSTAFDPGLS